MRLPTTQDGASYMNGIDKYLRILIVFDESDEWLRSVEVASLLEQKTCTVRYGIQKLWDSELLEARWENCTGDSAEEKAKEAETMGRHLRRYFHITPTGRRYLNEILSYRHS
jgi:Mn-dependent DtxR family transcriptional regulator